MSFDLVDGDKPAESVMKDAPQFDPKKPYAEIRGTPGVWYTQGAWLFDRAQRPVRPAPKDQQYIPPIEAQQSRRERTEQARAEATRIIGKKTPTVPKTVADAERENAQARSAEQQAS